MPIRYYSTLTDVSNFQANFPPFANASWIMKRTASAFIQFNDKSFREFHDAEKSESFVRFSQVHLSKNKHCFLMHWKMHGKTFCLAAKHDIE